MGGEPLLRMPVRSRIRHLALLTALALFVVVPAPVHADALVTVSATRNGSWVEVTGSAVLFDGPMVAVLDDPSGDTDVIGNSLAGDLVQVSLATRSNSDLQVRWSLVSLPADPAGVTSLARFRFRAGGADYEVAAARRDATAMDGCTASGLPCSGGWLLRCGPASCEWSPNGSNGGATLLSRDIAVTLNSAARFIQATVPVDLLDGVLAPGSSIEPYGGAPANEAVTAYGELERDNDADVGEMTGAYVYGLTVLLGSGPPGADPATIEYAVPAEVGEESVTFSGSLEVPPGQAVFAKACLGGPTNCAYGQSQGV